MMATLKSQPAQQRNKTNPATNNNANNNSHLAIRYHHNHPRNHHHIHSYASASLGCCESKTGSATSVAIQVPTTSIIQPQFQPQESLNSDATASISRTTHSNITHRPTDIELDSSSYASEARCGRQGSIASSSSTSSLTTSSPTSAAPQISTGDVTDIITSSSASTSTYTSTPTSVTSSSTSTTTSTSHDVVDDLPNPPPNYHEIPGVVPSYHGRTSGPPPSYEDVVNPNAPPPSYQSLFGQVREARKTSNGLVDLLRQLFLIVIGTLGCTMIIGFLLIIPITMIIIGSFYLNQCKAENIPSFLVIGGLVWIVKNILNCYNQFKKDSTTANRPPPRRPPISSQPSAHNSHAHPRHSHTNPNHSTTSPVGSRSLQPSNYTHNTTSITMRADQNHDNHNQNQNLQPRFRRPSLVRITSYKFESMLNYFLIVWFLAGCIVVYRIYEPDYEDPMSSSYCHRTVYLYAFWLITSAFIVMAVVLGCLCCLMVSSLMSCNNGR